MNFPLSTEQVRNVFNVPGQDVRNCEHHQGTEDVDRVEHGEGQHQVVEISLIKIFNKLYIGFIVSRSIQVHDNGKCERRSLLILRVKVMIQSRFPTRPPLKVADLKYECGIRYKAGIFCFEEMF